MTNTRTRPEVICVMISSIDGRLHPSRYTESPDGTAEQWSAAFEALHDGLDGDAWLVGRVTMAEMSKAGAHPPASVGTVERPVHIAQKADSHAIALDRSGKLHFDGGTLDGDHVIVLLGRDVPDSHLAELAADGVSYIVGEDADLDIAAMLDTLGHEFGIGRLLLEGGAGINGSLFAAGLVDEFHVLLAPALDGRPDSQAIVEADAGGLAGKVRLSLTSADATDHGIVHLRYAVEPA